MGFDPLAIGQVFGGLALFIYGMQLLSQGLKRAAGSGLRRLLFHLTRNRAAGALVGTVMGFLVHSSAATLMLVGFINAGLMSLSQAVGVVFGANLGTTLSMQLISFRLDEYCFVALAVGALLRVASRREVLSQLGVAIFGFGLLFLGMKTMGEGVLPFKDSGVLESVLRHTHADSVTGLLLGLLTSTALTALIQSSGAMVGILFALSAVGVFTTFDQFFPLLLGAHIGTCITALLGSIGTHPEARRAAIVHLLFNVLGAFLAIAMLSFYRHVVPMTGDTLTRQIANAHTLIQLINAFVFLVLATPFLRLVTKLTPSGATPVEKSHLDNRYLDTPEMAILASLRETQRMARLAHNGLRAAVRGLVEHTTRPFAEVARTEDAVDELKAVIERYLLQVVSRHLSKRQSILVQHLLQAVVDLERISDHANTLSDIIREKTERGVWFDDTHMGELLRGFDMADQLLHLTSQSLDPMLSKDERRGLVEEIVRIREEYVTHSKGLIASHRALVRAKEADPLTGVTFTRFVSNFDKIVRHAHAIAIAELDPVFFVKHHKLERRAPPLPYLPARIRREPDDKE